MRSAVNDRPGQIRQRAQTRGEAHAIERADLDQKQRKPGLRNQARLNAARGAHECDFVSLFAELFRDGEGRNDVAPGSATRQE